MEKIAKTSTHKYSSTPFDPSALAIFNQKDILFRMINEAKAYNKHPSHRALYDALLVSLSVDEDDMDLQLKDLYVQKKRPRDDQDQDPLTDTNKDFKKKKKKDSNTSSSKKTKDHPTSFKKGTTSSKSSKPDKSVYAYETSEGSVQDMAMDDEEPVIDEVVNDDEHPQDDDVQVKISPLAFDDLMGSTTNFSNSIKNCLKKDKITKADLECLVFKLLKGTTSSKSSKPDKSVYAYETSEGFVKDMAMDDEEPAIDEVVNDDEHPQDDDAQVKISPRSLRNLPDQKLLILNEAKTQIMMLDPNMIGLMYLRTLQNIQLHLMI
nr:hypothetical protein [Tanacetum cinerariifolium]